MDRETANATRLRVNRIALIQQIDVQELVPKLVRARILSVDSDIPYINEGTSRIDRARRLIDCLLAVNRNEQPTNRPANWYLQFRSILLENSSAYSDLVVALDNTVVRKPDFAQRVSDAFTDQRNAERSNQFRSQVNEELLRIAQPRRDEKPKTTTHQNDNQEQITKIEFDPYAMNKIVIEGQFQKVIDNLTYHSQFPQRLFDQLSNSTELYDREQLEFEKQAFDDMRRLELMNDLIKRETSLANQTLFETALVDSLLVDPTRFHHFYKYFFSLSAIYGNHLDREFLQAFTKTLQTSTNYFNTIEKGFRLYEFLYNYGRYELSRRVIEQIVQTLTKQVKEQNENSSKTWTFLFRSCCALIQVHNQSLEMKEAWARIEAAHEIIENLKSIQMEIPNEDYAWFYYTTSQTALEDANFDACIQHCYRGLKLAEKSNHSLVVDLLCSLSQGLTSKWIMNKAQATAVMAVQYAGKHCGRNSPKFITALQQLVNYSNEFYQDQSSVELSKFAFERARTVYGYESLAVAQAHRALSKSLIFLKSIQYTRLNGEEKRSDQNTFLHHAHEAFRIAQDWFGVEDRVRLFPFKMTLAHALQTQVSVVNDESKETFFNDAMELLDDCLSVAREIFGTMSFKVAQIHRLRSGAYLNRKMYDEAEEQLQICLQIYKLCLPPNSFHYLLSMASLGLIYKNQGLYGKALPLFQSVVETIDTKTQSFRWINMCLESLIECYNNLEGGRGESGRSSNAANNSVVDKIRSELYEWRKTNSKRVDLLGLIHQEPTRTLHQFLHDSTKFQETTDRIHALIHTQQRAKNRTSGFPINLQTQQ